MAETIWKYRLYQDELQTIYMPKNAQILCAQLQYDFLTLWAKVNPDEADAPRRIRIVETGHPIESCDLKHIGTVQFSEGDLVLHIFEELNREHTRHSDRQDCAGSVPAN